MLQHLYWTHTNLAVMTSPKQCGNSKEGLKVLSLAAKSKAGNLPCLNPWKQQPISLQCWTCSSTPKGPNIWGSVELISDFKIIKENISGEDFFIHKMTAMASDLPNDKWMELLTATLSPTYLLHRLYLWTPHLLSIFVQRQCTFKAIQPAVSLWAFLESFWIVFSLTEC